LPWWSGTISFLVTPNWVAPTYRKENDNEEVERVERPAEEASKYGMRACRNEPAAREPDIFSWLATPPVGHQREIAQRASYRENGKEAALLHRSQNKLARC